MLSEAERTALLKELDGLNAEVTAVLAKRKAWMDARMASFAKVQVGEDIYDLETNTKLGTVSSLYRYWDEQRNPLYDTTMDVNYQYHTGNNCYDNTSRRYVWVGTAEDAAWWAKRRAEAADRKARGVTILEDIDWAAIFDANPNS